MRKPIVSTAFGKHISFHATGKTLQDCYRLREALRSKLGGMITPYEVGSDYDNHDDNIVLRFDHHLRDNLDNVLSILDQFNSEVKNV